MNHNTRKVRSENDNELLDVRCHRCTTCFVMHKNLQIFFICIWKSIKIEKKVSLQNSSKNVSVLIHLDQNGHTGLNLENSRLPRILAEETLQKATYWVKGWNDIVHKANMEAITDFSPNVLGSYIPTLLDKLVKNEFCMFVECAQKLTSRDLYPQFVPLSQTYFSDEFSKNNISLILRD
ncbi:PREDICTED: uncharacterized protein LOC108358145 [Rhagoletis zephyria]|uniref:uncharacterized protein LOC108358145 n=1 Tax=Rhagoletis zephyria TaxID=28612 RepID=UPI0008112580|nr:PREDICTED: uncharacterized protein LOC108358145 [Rhagoletis zephyria]